MRILTPITLYANDVAFRRSERRGMAQLKLLIYRGLYQGYFPEPSKYIFIAENPEEKEAAKREFKRAVINLNYVDGGHFVGSYLGPGEEL